MQCISSFFCLMFTTTIQHLCSLHLFLSPSLSSPSPFISPSLPLSSPLASPSLPTPPNTSPLSSLLSPSLRESLSQLMKTRSGELNVELLLFAIQKTMSFEKLLAQRFSNSDYMALVSCYHDNTAHVTTHPTHVHVHVAPPTKTS